ncbi:TonB-dependent receptor domain-containing protein [Campylobacter curvus]|uniref:TonB-dependent receptor domain-containing protein n=1 Tax=Campylobacter curvus TaxID=200 RepID=UPI0014707848|nr:TonB-dependent receptor [Campylobacter curvus]
MRKGLKISLVLLSVASGFIYGDEPTEVRLDEVTVVSATGFEQNIKDAPASISVITQKQIAKKNHQDVESIIKDVPGVFGMTLGAASRRGITVRGFGSRYTKILIDGRPATSDSAYKGLRAIGSSQNFLPPANTIERVEVVRGPMSSLYGTDAIGGVINIITKGFSNELTGNVNGYYTFAKRSEIKNDFQTGFYLNGALVPDVLGVALYGRYFKKFEDTLSYGNRQNSDENFGVKFMYNATPNDEITLDLAKITNKYKRTAGRTLGATGSNNDVAREEMKGFTASLAHTGKYDKLLLESYLTYDKMKENGQQNLTLKTTTLNSKGTYFFDSNTLSLGGQFRHEKLNEKATTADAANVKRHDFSVFGEDEFYLTDRLNLTAGVRYNHDKDYGGHVSPRAYVVYHLNENFSFKGGVSTGYATPDIKQRTDGLALPFAGGMGAQLGRSDLKPESSVSYEAGVAYDDNEKFSFALMGFYTRLKDGISTQRICVPRPGTPCVHNGKTYARGIWDTINIGKADIKGIELSSQWQILSNLALNSSYTYTHSEQKTGSEKGKTLNNLPVHVLKIGLDYDASKELNLWTQLNYMSKSRDSLSYDEDIRSYALFDAGASYKLSKNTSINFSVYNLFNEFVTTRSGRYDLLIVDGTKFQLGFNVNF